MHLENKIEFCNGDFKIFSFFLKIYCKLNFVWLNNSVLILFPKVNVIVTLEQISILQNIVLCKMDIFSFFAFKLSRLLHIVLFYYVQSVKTTKVGNRSLLEWQWWSKYYLVWFFCPKTKADWLSRLATLAMIPDTHGTCKIFSLP